jgi:hypothetical protein
MKLTKAVVVLNSLKSLQIFRESAFEGGKKKTHEKQEGQKEEEEQQT